MSKSIAQSLSPREAALLRLASEGYTDNEIARRLEISESTVGTYWGRIRIKLGPFNRTELVALTIKSALFKEIERLQAQRDRFKTKLEEASAEERLYEEIVDAADEGVLIVTPSGSIEHANPAVAAVFGYERSELIGLPLSKLLPSKLRRKHDRHIDDFLRSPTNRAMNEHSDTAGLTKDGREVPLYITITSVRRGGEALLTAFIHSAAIGGETR